MRILATDWFGTSSSASPPERFLLTSLTCKDNVTPPDDVIPPGKRDYTWTVDTLAYPGSYQTLMIDIWASSPKDVYVVGYNDRGGRGTMYHYDGQRWTPVRLIASEGGTIRQGFSLSAIDGFAPNDVYAVGNYIYGNPTPPPNFLDSSLIIHFDGTRWNDVPITRDRTLLSILGVAPGELWAGGLGGIVYHYHSGGWDTLVTDPRIWFSSFAGSSPTEVYALAYQLDEVQPLDSVYYHFYGVSDSGLVQLHVYLQTQGAPPPSFRNRSLWIEKSTGTLYSAGYGIFKHTGSYWEEILQSEKRLGSIFGSSTKNIFAVGNWGVVYHYNGSDWKLLSELQSLTPRGTSYNAVWTNNMETFIVGTDGRQTYILHGK